MKLRQNTLSLGHIVASTLANIAPAMSFFFVFGPIVRGTGLAAILTILTAMVAIVFLANTIAQFSRFTPSAGSFVPFTGKAVGGSVGAAISVFIFFGFLVTRSPIVSIVRPSVAETLKTFAEISINWVIPTILVSLLVGWLVVRGIGISTLWAGIFFYFEAGLLVLAAVVMMVTHARYLTLAPFLVANLAGGIAGFG